MVRTSNATGAARSGAYRASFRTLIRLSAHSVYTLRLTPADSAHDISNQMAREVSQSSTSRNPLDDLSERELQVALLLMKGHKLTAVGEMLFLSDKTVSTYKRRAFKKLQVESLVQLIELGAEHGFSMR